MKEKHQKKSQPVPVPCQNEKTAHCWKSAVNPHTESIRTGMISPAQHSTFKSHWGSTSWSKLTQPVVGFGAKSLDEWRARTHLGSSWRAQAQWCDQRSVQRPPGRAGLPADSLGPSSPPLLEIAPATSKLVTVEWDSHGIITPCSGCLASERCC